MLMSIYSTALSGLFAFVAATGPRYGGSIRTHGALTPEGAIILTSVLAKTIELSFVTAFVAFLGQVLSRRAFIREQGRGVTLAEMSMRNWITQPGTLVTQWNAVKYAGLSLLGALSLVAAIMATLYTAAASALVQPQLKFGNWEPKLMTGMVRSSFANPQYMAEQCATPIKHDFDTQGNNVGGSTCLQLEHAAQGFTNYIQYLSNWKNISDLGDGTDQLQNRPRGTGLLGENISLMGQWVEIVDTATVSNNYGGRAVNNVSLAMPHAGVPAAAQLSQNGIIQPNDLDGQGIYSLHASVPSPVIHVLCANANRDELAPLVYSSWPGANTSALSEWPTMAATPQNKTVLDDIFGWNDWDNVTSPGEPRPAFPKLPKPFNTLLNHSIYYGPDAIYMLGRAPPGQGEIYTLCSLRASLTLSCSTRFNASGYGGSMEAICEDKNDDMQYLKSIDKPSPGFTATSGDWKNVATEWGNSLSLNAGEFDGDASNARLLTQLILNKPVLNKALPSPAEALAVMAGSTLVISTLNAPFVPFYVSDFYPFPTGGQRPSLHLI